ncbi:MAG: TGS domain-containing protein, partial [Peptoniphilus harei]|nr:TGS domain-containing protein [Peptoniphilus harei]
MIIKLPDGSKKEYESGVKVSKITGDISQGLLRDSLGAVVNGEILGLDDEVYEDSDFKVVKFEDIEGKKILWHTASHLMAYAIKELYPEAKFAIGPSTETGFYYDLDLEHRFVDEDLKAIEDKMKELAKKDLPVEKIEVSREEALKYFKEQNQDYKVELIEDLPEDEKITMYKIGGFTDLCKGPHLLSTKKIKAIKLLSIAGAYWRGDSNNKMLQRIYGIAFEKQKQLDEYIERREEAEKRD